MASVKANLQINLKIENRCVISGCFVPRRHEITHPDVGVRFWVCGIHRADLAELMNKAGDRMHEARRSAVQAVIDGVDDLGDHDAERELALAT